MTTIAFRAGVIAADTMISYTTITNGFRNKIAKCGDYSVALAGAAYLKIELEAWVAAGADKDNVPKILLAEEDKFSALIMDECGILYDFSKGYLMPVDAEYHAIGSGAHLAIGAMANGASAIEAVRCACLHDKASGGGITHVVAPLQFVSMPITGRASHQLPN